MLDSVIGEVIHNYKIEKSTLLQRKRHISFEARDVGVYILKMYTGLKNKVIGEIFGLSLSAVNKAALRVSIQRRKQKGLGERIEKNAYSAFKVRPYFYICGLSLDETEIFIRWLLIERAKYFRKFSDRKHKGWFVLKKGNNNPQDEGKKFFLQSVGFEIIELNDYKLMYEDIWK